MHALEAIGRCRGRHTHVALVISAVVFAIVLSACLPVVNRPSPAGCILRAHWPHPSGHAPGRVNATASVKCGVSVARMRIKPQLWKERWWGWDRVGDFNNFDKNNRTYGQANANASCDDEFTYVLVANGFTDEGPYTYHAEKSSEKRRLKGDESDAECFPV